jgi:hypothetical protein
MQEHHQIELSTLFGWSDGVQMDLSRATRRSVIVVSFVTVDCSAI